MEFPQELKYTEDHEWIRVEGNVGTIGITDHAQGELGDIVYVDIPNPSANVNKGDSFGTIEAVKTVAEMFTPVTGQLVEINSGLNDAPETVNSDPYGNGWIAKIKLSNPDELNSLMDADAYKAHLGK